ncbi:diguanylate cyclase [Marinobacter sp.]|uniref:sensor domain-containing diguanylate cyclase n=1 Tax=Marinobacter sp. TaxID=50741 RepID=UPI002B465DA4|nr:diguanylate cyclase [Marinobacter sp.]HKK56747.1 diguanylate cyclase [Marinobacter sp.]
MSSTSQFPTAVADRLQTAIWIFDIENLGMMWANAAGVALWGARDLADLCARDFRSEISSSARIRLNDYLALFRRNETVVESWTFYPKGIPQTLRCFCSGYQTEQRLAMLVEAHPVEEQDTQALRWQEALRHVSTLISIFDRHGQLVTQNPAARASCPDCMYLAESFTRQSDRDKALQWLAGGSESYSLEALVLTTSGERWHRVDLKRTVDPVTAERVVLASETDISDRVDSESAQINARERLAALLRNLRGGIVVEDENRGIVLTNKTFCELFGIAASPEDLEGADCAEAAEQSKSLFRDPEAFIVGIEAALEARKTIADELEMVNGRTVERTYVPVFHENLYLGHLWQYWDITDQKSNLLKLEHEANHDPLTGLWNRRRFEQALQATHNEAVRYHHPYSLVIMDIDHFKQVNDLYGHGEGDVVLRRLSRELASRLRQTDRLARWGGEEFVMLLPQTAQEGAFRLANDMRSRVRDLPFPVVGNITISMGIAEVDLDESPHKALRRADAALLRAKENGRNRVEKWHSDTVSPDAPAGVF